MKRHFTLLIKPYSYACNLRCRYCFYSAETKAADVGKPTKMSEKTMRNLVTTYYESSQPPYSFAFQGGEPLLTGVAFYETFVDVINSIMPKGTSVSFAFQTNGTLINDTWIAFFKKTRALLGVSIDGDKELHDAHRIDALGEGSFEKAYANFNRLREEGVDANILCTLNALTVNYPERIYRFLYDEAKVDYMQFIPIYDVTDEGPTEYSVTGDAYYQFMEEIFRLWEASSPRPSVRFFDNLQEIALGAPPSNCQLHPRCGAYYLVEGDGTVYPCDFYAEKRWVLGNVNTTSFKDIAKTSKSEKFNSLKAKYMEKHCGTCEVKSICNGGCPHYSREGRYVYCEMRKRFLKDHRAFFRI